jgi:thiamine-monophosphate kinase
MKLRQSAAGGPRLRELGEDRLVQKLADLLPRGKKVIAGSGDDAAIVAQPVGDNLTVLKTDCVVEYVHFDSTTPPAAIGWKAMMRPLSDFAAISGVPQFALVTLIAEGAKKVSWATGIYRGLKRAATHFNVSIVGGETSSTSGPAIISVSIAGYVEKDRWVSRRGGKPGDHLFVTGRLGRSIKGKHLRFVPRIHESRWLTANFQIHAMMDLSDGLGIDLPRLARASRSGFQLDTNALPLGPSATRKNAIADGEDYELLFAVSPTDNERLQKRWRDRFPRLHLTQIGLLNRKSAIKNPQLVRGYVHFR